MEELKSYNICFLGRTGSGKTSIINELWRAKFCTDPLVACTKHLQTTTMMSEEKDGYNSLTIFDTPGIGEYDDDTIYESYYLHAVKNAHCVVLVVTMDKTDAPIQRFMMRMKNYLPLGRDVRFVIALNHIDSNVVANEDGSYIPWDENLNCPTNECRELINQRITEIYEKYNDLFLNFDVVPVCAIRKYGINDIEEKILNKITLWKLIKSLFS